MPQSRPAPTDPEADVEPPNSAVSESQGLIFAAPPEQGDQHNYPPGPSPLLRTPRFDTPELGIFGASPRRRRRAVSDADSSGITNLKLAENQQVCDLLCVLD